MTNGAVAGFSVMALKFNFPIISCQVTVTRLNYTHLCSFVLISHCARYNFKLLSFTATANPQHRGVPKVNTLALEPPAG